MNEILKHKDFAAYIFDLDGTLLNTIADLASSLNHALQANDQPQRSVEEVRCFVGNGVRKLIERAVPHGTSPQLVETILEDFQNYYLVHSCDYTQPYDGVLSMLQTLRLQNKKIAVVSNKYDAATKYVCERYFGNLIDVAIGESEIISRKPSPDGVNEALRLLGVEASDAVYIGDSDIDILTARNAGLPCISVLWGFRDEAHLCSAGATCLVSHPEEIASRSNNSI